MRSNEARRRRERTAATDELVTSDRGDEYPADEDDTLILLFLSCHPALSPASQLALTLRAVGGLTTAEIARAFLVPEATIALRISRAKQRIKASGIPFRLPPEPERADRLRVVLHVLYLIFNEGYTTATGPDLRRSDLTAEAIRLTRHVHRRLPDDGEVTGLLALMLLTDARRTARGRPDGSLVPLAEQDRTRWNDQPRRCTRNGARPARGPRAAATTGSGPSNGCPPSPSCRARPPPGDGRRDRRRTRELPGSSTTHHEPSRAAIPRGPRGAAPPATIGPWHS
jgi:predicted RNA polymerase sigma factor